MSVAAKAERAYQNGDIIQLTGDKQGQLEEEFLCLTKPQDVEHKNRPGQLLPLGLKKETPWPKSSL